jgi:hypothetical protein
MEEPFSAAMNVSTIARAWVRGNTGITLEPNAFTNFHSTFNNIICCSFKTL